MPELSRTHQHNALIVLQVPNVMGQILAVLFLKDSWLAWSSGAPLKRSTAGAGVCPAAGQHLNQNNSERPTHNHTILEYFITTRNYNHQNAFRTAHSKTPSQGQLGLPELKTRDHQLPPSPHASSPPASQIFIVKRLGAPQHYHLVIDGKVWFLQNTGRGGFKFYLRAPGLRWGKWPQHLRHASSLCFSPTSLQRYLLLQLPARKLRAMRGRESISISLDSVLYSLQKGFSWIQ